MLMTSLFLVVLLPTYHRETISESKCHPGISIKEFDVICVWDGTCNSIGDWTVG